MEIAQANSHRVYEHNGLSRTGEKSSKDISVSSAIDT